MTKEYEDNNGESKDKIVRDANEISEAICNSFSRIWNTTTNCYQRSFNSIDPEDRQNLARLSLEVFQSMLGVIIEKTQPEDMRGE